MKRGGIPIVMNCMHSWFAKVNKTIYRIIAGLCCLFIFSVGISAEQHTVYADDRPSVEISVSVGDSENKEKAPATTDGSSSSEISDSEDKNTNKEKDSPNTTEEYPFGELPDMKDLFEAIDIIGETSLDSLSDEQKKELNAIGFDDKTIEENRTLIEEVIAGRPEGMDTDSENQTSSKQGKVIIEISCGALFVFAAVILIWIHRRKTHSRAQGQQQVPGENKS